MNRSDPSGISVLVLRLSALGDVANVMPAIAGLRKAADGIRIGWVVESTARDLVAASGLADEIFLYPRQRFVNLWTRPWLWPRAVAETRRFLQPIRAARYDYALDFQGNLKSALIGLFSGARDRIGFARGHCREMNWLFNRILAMPSSRRMLRAEKNVALAQVVAPDLAPMPPDLRGAEADKNAVAQLLQGLGGINKLVVLHPGASRFGQFKRWPEDSFGELAARLSRETNATCLITRGPGEESLARAVETSSGGLAHVAPLLSIGALIELLRQADLFIAGDTGPLHIAALLRVPIVAIFGPKDPAVYAPWTDTARIVRKDLPCSPCARRECDHTNCIMQITVEEVFHAVRTALR